MDDLDLDREPTEEPRKVRGLAVALLALLAAAGAAYYFVFMKKAAPAAEPAPAAAAAAPAAEEPPPGGPALEPLAFPAVGLDESDAAVREFAAALSADPDFAKWLLTKDLVRKFVVAVDNVANGLSPRPHVDFFAPQGAFRATRSRSGTAIDPASYARYEPLVRAAGSLDAAAAARLYRAVKPLIREAYDELGYPGVDFDDTLVRAMAELLGTPVVEGPVGLEQKVLSYAMTDPALEGLSAAQKQLLRMGPRGVTAVQGKIREVAAALGIAASRLPRPKASTPGLP
ncbi:MAG TPA: DUF3014 domain-containing protein [Candidatus Aminicenantes bacterium]|nr:DUF3014 domain-containing protein [Candidatus Aminicenantes bacterium]